MKKQILTLVSLMIFLTLSLNAQKVGEKILLNEKINLYSESSIMSKAMELSSGEYITILELENEKGYFYVETTLGKGYISSARVAANKKWDDPNYAAQVTQAQKEAKVKSSLNQIPRYIEMYGQPSDISSYVSGDYDSKTYTWNCAKGKYRSISFINKGGYYVADSVYESDCIR